MSPNRLVGDLMREERLKRDAYIAGQLAMRERAAKRAQKPLAPTSYATTYSDAIAQAIRALEPEEPK